MAINTIIEELRLGTDAQSLVRTFAHVREESTTNAREEVIALIELADRPAVGEDLLNAVFRTLKELCFVNPDMDPYERFEIALKEVNAVIAEGREQLPNKNLGRINAVIAFLSGNEMHLTQAGDAEAYLIRKGTLTTVTEGLSPEVNAVDTFVNIASGNLNMQDKVLFTTERLLRYATKNELLKIFTPYKKIELGLEELDEVIVLEGAQTTTVVGVDIASTAGSRGMSAGSGVTLPKFDGELGRHVEKLGKHLDRAAGWVRERIPSNIPSLPTSQSIKVPFDKNYLVLGVLIVVIGIILSLTWHFSSQPGGMSKEQVTQALTEIQSSLDSAQLRSTVDKAGASAELATAEQSARNLVTLGVATEEAEALLSKILAAQDQISSIRRYSQLTPLADISKTNPQANLIGLLPFRDRPAAIDAANLYEIVGQTVNTPVAVDAEAKLRTGAYFADRDALVLYADGGKIYEYRDGAASPLPTKDPTWKTGVDIDTYGTNLYLLDPVNNQIWRYIREREGYGAATGWSRAADLTKSVGIAVDGDIWVLNSDTDTDPTNDLMRLRQGERKTLGTIADLPANPWTKPTKIFTSENHKSLYVLDPSGKRVIQLLKRPTEPSENRELQYVQQFLFEDLADIRDMWVDTAEQKMYLTDGQKVYEVAMQ